jgi:hypothetical protein
MGKMRQTIMHSMNRQQARLQDDHPQGQCFFLQFILFRIMYCKLDSFGGGVLAPGSICSWFLKSVLNKVQNVKENSKKKNPRIVLDILFSHKAVSEETTFFVLCVKKTKFGAKLCVARDNFLSFLQDTKNVGFPQNLACAHKMSRCTC